MRIGLRDKIFLLGWGLTLFVGLSGLVGYWFFYDRTQMNSLIEKGRILGQDLALQSEGHLVRGTDLELRHLVERFVGIKGVSYVLITDIEGKVRASTLRDEERIKGIIERKQSDQGEVKVIRLAYNQGHEFTVPILEGTLGFVHLGLSSFAQKSKDYWKIEGTFLGGSIFLSWILVLLFSHRLSKRLLRLAQETERVSLGNMEERISPGSQDEVGKLAQATDRLRISLQAALERLEKGEGFERT